jgi:hypothetical protein
MTGSICCLVIHTSTLPFPYANPDACLGTVLVVIARNNK